MSTSAIRSEIVSHDSESLILVDSNDQELGYLSKVECHQGAGILHRAFSLFIFNESGELLIHQRAEEKPLWPGFWSNSCCSHPRQGESIANAMQRRCAEELGFTTTLRFLYQFEYAATYQDLGSERELCSVFWGLYNDSPNVNVAEISDWRWVNPNSLTQDMAARPERYTPWFQMEWQRIRTEFSNQIPKAD